MTQSDQNNIQQSSIDEIIHDEMELKNVLIESNNKLENVPTERNAFKYRYYRTLRKCLWIYPLLVAILLPSFCFGAYFYAIYTKQMNPLLPYISDTIGVAPQGGIANAIFDIVTILILITGYLRYKQLKYYLNFKTNSKANENLDHFNSLNFFSILSLFFGSFGMLLITNCRLPENPVLHNTGLVIFIVGLSCYFTFMIHVTNHLSVNYQIETKPTTMLVTCAVGVTCLVTMLMLTTINMAQVGFTNFMDNQWRFNWSEDQPGYWTHVVCTAIEWIGIVGSGVVLYGCLFLRIKNFKEWKKVRFA